MRSGDEPGGDLYGLLGVAADVSQREIGPAYRRAAQRLHPDARPADPTAAAQFRALSDAYDVLRDPGRRAAYDRQRVASRAVHSAPARDRAAWSAAGPAVLPPGVPLWAGPVRIEPPAGAVPAGEPPARTARGDAWPAAASGIAAFADLLGGYLGDDWGWRR